jgi:tetratricopeptide (TPR) repeat protein
LMPVLGFVPVAYYHISWVADHFSYLASLGLFGLVAAAFATERAWLPESRIARDRARTPSHRSPDTRLGGWAIDGRRSVLTGLVAAVIVAGLLAEESRRYSKVFKNEEALWSYTPSREPQSWTALNNMGKVLLKQGRTEEAVPILEKALRLSPAYVAGDIDLNLSMALALQGRPFEAIRRCQEAIRLRPGDAGAHGNLGNLYSELGRLPEALAEYEEAVRLQPDSAAAHNNLGTALTSAGRLPEAIAECAEAVRLDPQFVDARYNLAVALGRAGRNLEALSQFEKVLRLAPDRPDAHNNLGIVLVGMGRLPEARAEFEAALRLKPDFGQAIENLAHVNRASAPAP